MRAMSFKGLAILTMLALAVTVGAEYARAGTQQDAVDDSFDWATGIVDGLAGLSAAPVITVIPPTEPIQKSHPKRKKPKVEEPTPRPTPMAPAFVGRRFTLQKNTVFGVFDVTVLETSSNSFNLTIVSAEPAENVEVKDSVAEKVYVDRPLDDETTFTVHVAGPLSPAIAVSVSVLQDGDINKAYFPLLGSDSRN